MSNNTYAIVGADGNIINLVMWDGVSDFVAPNNMKIIASDGVNCAMGGTYKDGNFVAAIMPEKTKAELTAEADAKKADLIQNINTVTQIWQTQLALSIITDADKATLTTWMKYAQEVQAVDTSTAPDITWPTPPTATASATMAITT